MPFTVDVEREDGASYKRCLGPYGTVVTVQSSLQLHVSHSVRAPTLRLVRTQAQYR